MAGFDHERLIYDVPDYPKPGVVFKDLTPLIADAEGFAASVRELADAFRGKGVTKVIGAEARGFIFGGPVALELGAGFVPCRKPGKLPRETAFEEYELEYGSAELHIHLDSIEPGDKAILVDDLIATGGTAIAMVKLVERLGAELLGIAVITELEFLKPRELLSQVTDAELVSLVKVR